MVILQVKTMAESNLYISFPLKEGNTYALYLVSIAFIFKGCLFWIGPFVGQPPHPDTIFGSDWSLNFSLDRSSALWPVSQPNFPGRRLYFKGPFLRKWGGQGLPQGIPTTGLALGPRGHSVHTYTPKHGQPHPYYRQCTLTFSILILFH